MPEKAVSIVIPLHNNAKYFRQCINSVLSQSLKNIEIIIIDDCSTDEDYETLISEFKDSRLKILRNEKQQGSGISRNKGIILAKGEYIAFLDSDDFYPNCDSLKSLYEIAKSNDLNVCGGSLFIVNDKSMVINSRVQGQYFDQSGIISYWDYQHDGGFYRFIYRRKFLIRNELKFPNLKRMQDPVFFVKAMLKAKYFYAINSYVYAYRKNHKELIWDREKVIDHYTAIKEILHLSSKNNLAHLHYLMVKNFYHFSIKNLKKINNLQEQFSIVSSIIKVINFSLLDKKWKSDTESFYPAKLFTVLIFSLIKGKVNS